MGACTSFFLSQKATAHQLRVTVIERTGVACAASGKAGGFLARDWSDAELGNLSAASFDLHTKLAKELDGVNNYGYRRVNSYSVSFGKTKHSKPSDLHWLDQDNVKSVSVLGTPDTTAQVHPREFTQLLFDKAVETGHVQIIYHAVTRLSYDKEDKKKVTGVVLDNGETLTADAVVLCMGPWSGKLELSDSGIPSQKLPVSGTRAHSVVVTPDCELPDHVVFTSIEDEGYTTPEVYLRPDGTAYICLANDNEPLPESADKVQTDANALKNLERLATKISSHLSNRPVVAEQACYLPISKDGLPLIGTHPHHTQLFLATGHSCWGILNGPVTGLMMSELLTDKKISCVDEHTVTAMDPKHRL
ncbi:hypothetical protein EC973_004056 [Apophysomyces ossiformis]|uniref:FAD dependent oxidoreductase domain-containing protein n=1 Tax=Apophysomyces ossiformis TaxID=679940 RepID=A0A8H7EMQ4_9FUNG|nr:hypothetical protein EC973_004056 [Apophysomyces ossiformis]